VTEKSTVSTTTISKSTSGTEALRYYFLVINSLVLLLLLE
jgi:hypothetical protein